MKVKNISGGPLDCWSTPLGRSVEAGEIVDVPETWDDGTPCTWSAAHFEVVPDKPAKTEKAAS